MSVTGLLLAAGGGSRMGAPKALVHGDDGEPWVRRGVRVLREAGCPDVVVVLGAAAGEAQALLDGVQAAGVRTVVAEDWASGMAASLAVGLRALDPRAEAALITLVDLPDVGPEVGRRLLAGDVAPDTLTRAVYDGRPGHPVLMGRDHWEPAAASVGGDHGAQDYLRTHACIAVECSDLATGHDVDRR